jgi:DNA-binding CsgD family transcriptional regulator
VGIAAAATSLDDLGKALPHLRTAISASSMLLFRYGEPGQLIPVAGDLAPEIDNYIRAHYQDDVCHQAARRIRPRHRIVRYHQLVDDRRRHRASVVYNEFYRPHDIEYFACPWLTRLPYGKPGMVGMLIGRGRKQGDFANDDLARLQLAFSALVGATERGLRIALDRAVLDAVLDATSTRPCFALDEQCRVVWASTKAERLVGPILAHNALPHELVVTARRLWRAAGPLRDIRLPALQHGPVVAVRISCSGKSIRADLSVVGSCKRIIVVTLDVAEPDRAVVNTLAERHGLTLAETDVLGWLCHGLTNREIAKRSFVSVETVRTHVKHLFSKLGVATRTEAALLVRR